MSSIIVPRVLTRYWSINFDRKFLFSKSVYFLIPAEIVSGSPTCPKAPISISTPFSVLGAALEVNDSDPAEIILNPLSHILELQYYCLFLRRLALAIPTGFAATRASNLGRQTLE